ncbi:dTDP-4-dehydrorhamnose 3,5-epimerase [soil metagenome]
MILTETKIKGAFIIGAEQIEDERGFFARSWSEREWRAHGLDPRLVECNISFNKKRGTLRGMHFQTAPREQPKLVRCTMGALYDVIIDLRLGSETFKQWVAIELTAGNRLMLYIPEGLAHGFQTLSDETEIFYQMSEVYDAESAAGVRWNDPAFGIEWPEIEERVMSVRDQLYPDFVL